MLLLYNVAAQGSWKVFNCFGGWFHHTTIKSLFLFFIFPPLQVPIEAQGASFILLYFVFKYFFFIYMQKADKIANYIFRLIFKSIPCNNHRYIIRSLCSCSLSSSFCSFIKLFIKLKGMRRKNI